MPKYFVPADSSHEFLLSLPRQELQLQEGITRPGSLQTLRRQLGKHQNRNVTSSTTEGHAGAKVTFRCSSCVAGRHGCSIYAKRWFLATVATHKVPAWGYNGTSLYNCNLTKGTWICSCSTSARMPLCTKAQFCQWLRLQSVEVGPSCNSDTKTSGGNHP